MVTCIGGIALKATLPPAQAAATRALPTSFALHQNQPNPFSARTTIRFELPLGAMVRLEVFDLKGRRLRVLADRYTPLGPRRARGAGRR